MELSVFKKYLNQLDKKLENYFDKLSTYIKCKKGCSDCCQKGDYPLSEIEMQLILEGYLALNNETKIKVQQNIKEIKKGETCPFLLNNECSIYSSRPIICRVHGLAYLCKDNTVKLPYCVNTNKNYASLYNGEEFVGSPIKENLDTINLLQGFEFGEIRNLYDWLHTEK